MLLEGKKAFVTGGSRGIGAAIALKLASEGADVAISYAGNDEAATDTCRQIVEMGRQALALKFDVGNFEETGQAVEEAIKTLGRVDILVNNAGIVRDGLILSMKEEDFDSVIATNLKGAFNMIKHLYKPMMKQRQGKIVNISSIVGVNGNAGQANYAASKAGLIGLTKSVAKELAGRNINCNALAPGYIETDMTSSLSPAIIDSYVKSIPLKRAGKAQDVADAVLFLVGPSSDYITGQVITVDGGLSM